MDLITEERSVDQDVSDEDDNQSRFPDTKIKIDLSGSK